MNLLTYKYIKSSSSNLATVQSLNQICLINDSTSGTVDNNSCILHLFQLFCRNHVLCLLCQRNVNGNNITILQKILIICIVLISHSFNLLFCQERVITGNLHTNTSAKRCSVTADTAKSDDSGFLSVKLKLLMCITDCPVALGSLNLCLNKVFGKSQHQCQGMLCNSTVVCTRCDNYRNTKLCRCIYIYAVIANSGSSDNLQPWSCLHNCFVYNLCRSSTYDQRICILHFLCIVCRVCVMCNINLLALVKKSHPFRSNCFCHYILHN